MCTLNLRKFFLATSSKRGFLLAGSNCTMDVVQILQSLSYKVFLIVLSKLAKFGLFIVNLGISTIIDQAGCCYDDTGNCSARCPIKSFPFSD